MIIVSCDHRYTGCMINRLLQLCMTGQRSEVPSIIHRMHNGTFIPSAAWQCTIMRCIVQDNTPGTDRNRHNQQSMTENVKEVLPGTKEHEGANEGLGHKIAKHIPGYVPCQPPCTNVGKAQEVVKVQHPEEYRQNKLADDLSLNCGSSFAKLFADLRFLPAGLMPTRSTRTRSECTPASAILTCHNFGSTGFDVAVSAVI